LVEQSVEEGLPFRAVVADSFYGEDEGFKRSLSELGVGYVMALKPSHAWWHKIGEIGSPYEAAVAAGEGWEDEKRPGEWVRVVRSFRDGHEEVWWALEVDVGPYGPQRSRRSVVATTDPQRLPEKATWYLVTNLPHPECSERAHEEESELEAAHLAEIVRLYGLRMWVEQSYKQVKHVLGWSDYQVRSDKAIRRHWELVCCAFSFCWWAYGRLPTEELAETENDPTTAESAGRGEKEARGILAGDAQGGKGVVGALRNAHAILEGVLRNAPTTEAKSAA
jgi:DDE superfamily endonuclease